MTIDTTLLDIKVLENIQTLANTLLEYPTSEENISITIRALVGISVIIGDAYDINPLLILNAAVESAEADPEKLQHMRGSITWEKQQ